MTRPRVFEMRTRRDHVSQPRHWEVDRDAMSAMLHAYGYPPLRPPQLRQGDGVLQYVKDHRR